MAAAARSSSIQPPENQEFNEDLVVLIPNQAIKNARSIIVGNFSCSKILHRGTIKEMIKKELEHGFFQGDS